MPAALVASKVFIPPLRPSLVARPRLVQLLNEGLAAKRRLSLVSAPAGFGKTTLVVDWLRQTARPAAWLSLEETDNDLARFLSYLIAAFQQVDEETGIPLQSALQSPQLPPIERLLAGLLNEIALRAEPLILVLDDYHLLREAAIVEAMEFVLDHQPPNLHLVLTTREDPDLPLARWRARDQLTEIRARDLRFTQAEADHFLREVMGLTLSEQDVVTLEGRTEGWAAGLQLAGLSMQKQSDLTSFITDFSGSHRHILDYLTGEVLQRQPEGIRTFLLQTSILERLSGPLCDSLLERSDSDRVLAHLEAANLFVIPLDEERRWYRYHQLFSDLLRSQLTRTQPGSIPGLHRRASRWFAGQGDIQAAIDHALQDTDLTQAARLIEQHALPKLYQGQVALVIDWFDRLPGAVLESAPLLCISKAWAFAVMQGLPTRQEEVERALHAADQALDRTQAGEALRALVAGHAASIRAFSMQIAALKDKKAEELIVLSQEAQRLLPEDEKGIRSVNAFNIGYGYLALADLEAASEAFTQTLEYGLAGGNYYAGIYGPINLILIALLVGRRKEALQLCDGNIERFNQLLAGQYFPPIGALYVLKGSILVEHDRLAEAEQPLTEGLDLIRWTGETMVHRTGYRALARLRAIQGDRTAMSEAVKTLEKIIPEEALFAQALRHRLSMSHWPADRDVGKDAKTWLDRSGIEFGELAVIDSLEYTGAAGFHGYLDAAYVLARLANERPGAYPLAGVHAYLRRQAEFAETHGILSWVVEVAIARALLYLAQGKQEEAFETLERAVRAAAPTGLLRVFVDEGKALQPLLAQVRTRLRDEALVTYADRLLEAMSYGAERPETRAAPADPLSRRELEVLRHLARGLSYEETGRQLFLSLNTVQSHVKSIYRKLLVNKRLQAIEKAREMNLI
jgi:LuxR family transcriptional regulator, maltose regulon positive regulatory protein